MGDDMGSKKFWIVAAAWPVICGVIYVGTYYGGYAIWRVAEWMGKALDEEA